MAHEIFGIVKCSLCSKTFSGPAGISLVGATQPKNASQNGRPQADPRTFQFLAQLANHAMVDHKDQDQLAQLRATEYLGMLRMQVFRTADKAILEQIDYLRWQIHQQTLAAVIPDHNLKLKSAEFATDLVTLVVEMVDKMDPEDEDATHELIEAAISAAADRVIELIRGIRDILQEPDKYRPSAILDPNTQAPATH